MVAVIGEKNTGKTTLIERIVGDLTSRGCRVAVGKHVHHGDFDVDVRGKDTWRAYRAGAVAVAGVSRSKLFLVARRNGESLGETIRLLEETGRPDVILLEGFAGMLDEAGSGAYVVLTGGKKPGRGEVIARVGSDSYEELLARIESMAGCSPKTQD